MNLIRCADCVHFHQQHRAGPTADRPTMFAICAARSKSQPEQLNTIPGLPVVRDGVAEVVLVRRTELKTDCTQAIKKAG